VIRKKGKEILGSGETVLLDHGGSYKTGRDHHNGAKQMKLSVLCLLPIKRVLSTALS
jgi:hypothetical protein